MNSKIACIDRLWIVICLWAVIQMIGCKGESKIDCSCGEEICSSCEMKIIDIENQYAAEYLDNDAGMFELISNFHRATRQSKSAGFLTDQVDMYFDMSSGLHAKVSQTRRGDKDLLTDLINIVSRKKAEYFRLNSNLKTKLEPIRNQQVGDVKVFVRNPVNYNSQNNYAPLDTAVETIVNNHDRQSIFITDGELARRNIPGVVDPTAAWAVRPFTKWLGEGNRLDFIVLTYENGERLFFIFFTPEKLASSESSIVESFLEATNDLEKNDSYKHLKFTINDYRLEKVSDGRAQGENGINSTFVDWVVDYTRKEVISEGFEHIHVYDDKAFYQYMEDFAAGIYNEDFQSALDEKNKLFYNLMMTNEFINYQIANLDIKVEDISRPLTDYMDFQKCRMADTISVVDEEGDRHIYWCNPYNNCEDTTHCDFEESSYYGSPVREIFSLHEESEMALGANQFYTAKIAVRPARNFNLDQWWSLGQMRINIYIKNVIYDEKKQDFDQLRWPYQNTINTGLSESVRLAMQELKPQNKLIYTYYITSQVQQ